MVALGMIFISIHAITDSATSSFSLLNKIVGLEMIFISTHAITDLYGNLENLHDKSV